MTTRTARSPEELKSFEVLDASLDESMRIDGDETLATVSPDADPEDSPKRWTFLASYHLWRMRGYLVLLAVMVGAVVVAAFFLVDRPTDVVAILLVSFASALGVAAIGALAVINYGSHLRAKRLAAGGGFASVSRVGRRSVYVAQRIGSSMGTMTVPYAKISRVEVVGPSYPAKVVLYDEQDAPSIEIPRVERAEAERFAMALAGAKRAAAV